MGSGHGKCLASNGIVMKYPLEMGYNAFLEGKKNLIHINYGKIYSL